MNRSIYLRLLLLVALLVPQTLPAQEENLRITVVDESGVPLQGVHLVLYPLCRLLATTDRDGECLIDWSRLSPSDTIEISCLGLEPCRVVPKQGEREIRVELKERPVELQEVTVLPLSTGEILAQARKQVVQKKKIKDYFTHYGKGQYEKVTECYEKAVEYRREYGVFFTAGYDGRDQFIENEFLPAYVRRSLNLTPDGKDTLKILTGFGEPERKRGLSYYIAGERKVFMLMLAIMNKGPVFADLKHYDLTPLDSEGETFCFRFKTRPGAHPKMNTLFCYGTLYIDMHTLRLTRIALEHIEYQLYYLSYYGNRHHGKAHSPFATTADMAFAYSDEGKCYVERCTMRTTWKFNFDRPYRSREHASRLEPADCRLVEQEAFYCDSFKQIPESFKRNELIHWGCGNPKGQNHAAFFDSKPVLLDTIKPFRELSAYMDIYEQFKRTDGQPYYGRDYLSSWAPRGTKPDEAFFQHFDLARLALLNRFFLYGP